ncbi:hypothetical protein CPAST_c02310 [Clostridium pasteurianum DSM 525 = ATCC 6013]|uniref:DUF2680 domain-containing protein n=1 Tax=Clostridium pasteurianum DSM 525 = ATCC 6013 TaxID=1262449 RepID=A0A0H3IXW5_CLOPA|nr:hypothetical protein [Clostridium pasteurianum]AJA46331.1 hypothetical protein CPAST_c02310 [Clostridium pasteurianum DSM 525 = ATCC 6013]AJA50319.1 hypothetical protein CLPA_c02310 [Clostridium pasteurianum DSM 525 = ATCC 6013]AOZ73773.1 hypothetical protein AQ983_01110 [Clostridium pasteurianum DSM 525 = ATCC 6013]AOZ77570.1 hypothetical protein AQ984_01110 [Clostridium pasteurianum]ELP60908.1 hypothetical protein F502_00575 [Clostridium pasteurianum DSM 525 = ATCC 6013]
MIKFVKKIAAMALCLAIGISATAYANPETNNAAKKENINQYNKGVNEENKGHDNTENKGSHEGHHHKGKILDKLGITREELEEARGSGKSFFDLAKAKGHSESEVKKIMIEDRNNYIDQAVKDKKITKEKADQIKNIVNEKIKNWDGNLKEDSHNRDEENKTKENFNEGNSGSNVNDENNSSKKGTTSEGNTNKETTDSTTNKNDVNSENKGSSENSSDNKSNIENEANKENAKSNTSKDNKTQNNTTNNKYKSNSNR